MKGQLEDLLLDEPSFFESFHSSKYEGAGGALEVVEETEAAIGRIKYLFN